MRQIYNKFLFFIIFFWNIYENIINSKVILESLQLQHIIFFQSKFHKILSFFRKVNFHTFSDFIHIVLLHYTLNLSIILFLIVSLRFIKFVLDT